MGEHVDCVEARTLLAILFPPETTTAGKIRLQQPPSTYSSPWANHGPEWLPSDVDRLITAAERQRVEHDVRFGVALYQTKADRRRGWPSEVPALWVRSMAGDPTVNPLPDAPPSFVIASIAGREVAYGWLLDGTLDPAKADDLVVALAGTLGPELEPVLSDGYVRLPDTVDHTNTFSVLVRLLDNNARHYSVAQFMELVARRRAGDAIAMGGEQGEAAAEQSATDSDIDIDIDADGEPSAAHVAATGPGR